MPSASINRIGPGGPVIFVMESGLPRQLGKSTRSGMRSDTRANFPASDDSKTGSIPTNKPRRKSDAELRAANIVFTFQESERWLVYRNNEYPCGSIAATQVSIHSPTMIQYTYWRIWPPFPSTPISESANPFSVGLFLAFEIRLLQAKRPRSPASSRIGRLDRPDVPDMCPPQI